MTVSPPTAPAGPSAKQAFLQSIDDDIDLPALGSTVSRVVQLASDDDQAIHELTYFVLSDVALTQKILRLSNTVSYRTMSGAKVTTISRAIYLLGFDTVKTCALALIVVERLANARHSHALRTELATALYASVLSRELAKSQRRAGAEEVAIAALFANLGRILVAAYDYPHYEQISALAECEHISQEKACMKVLGCGFNALAQSVLRDWNLPDSITQAVAPPAAGILKPAKKNQEWVQQAAGFGIEASRLLAAPQAPDAELMKKALVERFGAALEINGEKLDMLLQSVEAETGMLEEILGLSELELEADEQESAVEQEEKSGEAERDAVIPEAFLMQAAPDAAREPELHPSGKPLDARDRLLAGVQEVTQMTEAGHGKINEVILHVLETLYSSMGFRFAAICLKDAKSGEYRARLALGENASRLRTQLAFCAEKQDLFRLAMNSESDLMISDASDPKIAALLPPWHRTLFADARSFIVLPIVVRKNPLGFFYADRKQPAPEGVPSDEAALIRILKSHVVSVLSKR